MIRLDMCIAWEVQEGILCNYEGTVWESGYVQVWLREFIHHILGYMFEKFCAGKPKHFDKRMKLNENTKLKPKYKF